MCEQWCWKNSIRLCCFHQIEEKKFFFLKIFSTNQNSRKYQSQFSDLFVIGIRSGVDTDAEKILLTFLVFFKSRRKNFFFLKIFSTNHNSRKNEIQLFVLFVIGIERCVNNDAEKILFAFVVFTKSRRKNFFFWKFFRPIKIRESTKVNLATYLSLESGVESTLMLKKFSWLFLCSSNRGEKIFFFLKFFRPIIIREKMKFNYSIFLSLELRDVWTVMLKKFYSPLLYSPNRGEHIFFFLKIFRPIRFRKKMEFNYSIVLLLELGDVWTVILEKFYWPLLYFPNRGEKVFFFENFFDQSDFEKNSNSIIRFFCHWNWEMCEQWCWKNSIRLCCFLQIERKKFFFLKIFSTNQNSRQNEIQLFDLFVIGIERCVNNDAEKILFAFVVFSRSRRKNFFNQSEFEKVPKSI